MRRIAFLVLALTGCASAPDPSTEVSSGRSGAVGIREITEAVPASGRLTLSQQESFQMPLAEQALALPSYPESLLAQRLPPQIVCLRVGIGADGKVVGTWPSPNADGCPGPDDVDARFRDAAAATAAQWRFDPAFRCVFPDAATKARAGALGCLGGREVPQAVTLAYRFVFEQQGGRGKVRLGD
ncbi:hypothetical protein N800_06225 [Lysobacter daejeonensis GH1-9]|uniref:TonB C-terminal domain-containing protein n=1 Tax=Lysobacter daejeonensis GH1-9 TaxID=1385517 RepID=A0A0A0EX39_9GAMM|nr:hypothetical protein [Lysobacter daejeonensis]KGM53722.1 hypothetical protein N800_06225 [Lysobacter daejeonensis GH1-9]